MAGGKMGPRQRMINLMYLVFIAMLALNMSKEVLSAFGILNEKISDANIAADNRNEAFLASLQGKASEQPEQYGDLIKEAQEVETLSSGLDDYIAGVKADMIKEFEDPTDYEVQDKGDYLNQKFFNGDNLSPEGQAFKDNIEKYRDGMIEIVGESYPQIAEELEKKFYTGVEENRDGVKIEWMHYHYEGYPSIASRTKMTQMQADIKAIQNELLSAMLQGEQAAQLSMNNYQAIVLPEKSAFYSGENFKGKVVLGRYDNSTSFDKIIVRGKEMQATNGEILLDFPAGNVGTQEIVGELQFKEGDEVVTLPFKDSYAVINRPNSATISADKMNVVYRGVENPMTIGFAGVSDNNVTANATGLSKVNGSSYVMRPGSGYEVKINVSAVLPDGGNATDSKTFRIKDIPSPVGAIRGETGMAKMQKNQLAISTVSAELPDFDFDLDIVVTGFKFSVPGQPSVQVNGSKLDGRAADVLNRAPRGSTVQIFDINAQIRGNSGYMLPKVSPVLIELTN